MVPVAPFVQASISTNIDDRYILVRSIQCSITMKLEKRILPQGKPRVREIANPNKLRIIAGSARGKKIDSPDVYLRPMMAKVREAVFSTLTHLGLFDENSARVLDMFAGSGSVGLEALSRGAAFSTFVDFSEECILTALRNAESCGFKGKVNAVCARAEDVLLNPSKYGLNEPYQLISMTPPYLEISYPELISGVLKSPLVTDNTIIIMEYPIEMGTMPFILGDQQMIGLRNRRYGRTVLAMYVNRPTLQFDYKQEEFTNEAIKK